MPPLKEILGLLRSPEESDRRAGIIELVRSKDPMRIPLLVKLAGEDPSVEIRYYAKKALDAIKSALEPPEPSRPGLVETTIQDMLDSGDPRVRLAGLKKALENPTPELVALVRCGLEREVHSQLKASFVTALGRIGGPDDIPALADCLKEEDQRIRANAVEALATIGTDQALTFLVPLLQDEDNRVKANTIKALQAFGGQALLALLARMAQDEPLWMRDSALYALSHLRHQKSLEILAGIAAGDPLPRLREKACQILEAIAGEGNATAQSLLARVKAPEPPAPPPAAPPAPPPAPTSPASPGPARAEASVPAPPPEPGPNLEPPPGPVSAPLPEPAPPVPSGPESAPFENDLAHPKPIRRRLALLKIGLTPAPEELPRVFTALSQETDPFLITRMLMMVKKARPREGGPDLLRFLQSSDARVRANAVEVIAILDRENSLSHLSPLLTDASNRVRANAILALLPHGGFDPIPPLRGLAQDSRELFRRSAVYVISTSPRKEFLSLLSRLLDDSVPRVRDLAFHTLEEYVTAKIAGAAELRETIQSRIGISFQKERFFENTFDRLFSRMLRSEESPAETTGEFRDLQLADRERAVLKDLGARSLAEGILSPGWLQEIERVTRELETLRAEAREENLIAPESTGAGLSPSVILASEAELIRLEEATLVRRHEDLLIAAGEEVSTRLGTLPPPVLSKLAPEVQKVKGLKVVHIPPANTTLLPPITADLTEIFDLTMRIYQKHVLAFSILAILLGSILAGYVFSAAVVLAMIPRDEPIVRGIFLLCACGIGLVFFLLLNGALKLSVTLMLREFLRGGHPRYGDIWQKIRETQCLSNLQLRKYGYLLGWTLLGILCSSLFAVGAAIAAESLLGRTWMGLALVKVSAMLGFLLIMARPFGRYLLVEPVAVLASERDKSDQIVRALNLASPYAWRLLALYVLANTLMTFITGTSTQILAFFAVIPGGTALLIAFSLLSEACLYPLVYSNLVVFTLMLLQDEKTRQPA